MTKSRFFQNLSLSHSVAVLTFDPGSSIASTKVLWKVPADVSASDLMTSASLIVQNLGPRLNEYHTRQMRKEFACKYSNIGGSTIPPHVLRAIYADMTSDATADQNPTMDARVRQAVLAEDPEMVVDIRHLNKGRPDDTFDPFFTELEKQVDALSAADERRHNVEHIYI